jgi:predicted kinase
LQYARTGVNISLRGEMATIHVLCGFIGSGKTTFAKRIEAETGAVRFTMDDWMIPLFGEHMSRDGMNRRMAFFEERFRALAVKFVEHGADVILDFGFWKRPARDDIRRWAASVGAKTRMVHFAATLGECRARVLARTAAGNDGGYSVDGDMFDALVRLYEPPTSDEHFDAIVGCRRRRR